DCGMNQSPRPNTIVGYYPAYKYNLKSNDFNISSSITHLNYIAFSPNDLINVTRPYTVFQNQLDKLNQLRNYLVGKPNLKFQLILSVLLPTNEDLVKIPPFSDLASMLYNPNHNITDDLVKIVNDNSFDGIDIDYPNKLPCYQMSQPQNFGSEDLNPVFISFLADLSSKLRQSNSSKILTVTAGQYPIDSLNSSNSDIINFVNIQAFYLNIGNKSASAGIDNIQRIFNAWNSHVSKSKLVLGIDFGGIVEVVNSSNIIADTNNQNLQVVNDLTTQISFADDKIQDLCGLSVYASWSWKNLSSQLLSPCYTSTNKHSQWNYGFDNKSQQPYIYQQQPNSPTRFYYVSYEDFQSIKSKLDYVQEVNALGIAISDITKDTNDATLMNFITTDVINPPNSSSKPTPTSISSTPRSSPSHIGVIVGGIIGALIFVSVLTAAGFILYRRKHRARMPALLLNTNNQTCSDTNNNVYSDINHQ
ncbi:12945_t:CDS:2, partial [Racocetra persica]